MSDQNEDILRENSAAMKSMAAEIAELKAKQQEILDAINSFIAQASPVVDQVVPTIEAFTNIPMVRMALGVKKGQLSNGKR